MKKLFTGAVFLSQFLICAVAFAGGHEGSGDGVFGLALSAGLAIALAAFGGAIGQGKAAAAALEGIARNPGAAGKIQTPMIIGLALIESLVIYALVIAFLLQGKIDTLIAG